jgi:glycosyltransferase involved in cell wall biosynthesis
VCEAGSAESLALAITRILSDAIFAEKIGQNGRKNALDRFTVSSMTDAYERLLHDEATTMAYTAGAS